MMVSEVKDKVECDICGKKYTNLKQHINMAHPESPEETSPPEQEPPMVALSDEYIIEAAKLLDMSEHPLVIELREKVSTMEKIIELTGNTKPVGKTVEEIAKILYLDVARVICDESDIPLKAWENVDQNGYLKVAGKIKG